MCRIAKTVGRGIAATFAHGPALAVAQIGQTAARTFDSAVADDHSDRHSGQRYGKDDDGNANRWPDHCSLSTAG